MPVPAAGHAAEPGRRDPRRHRAAFPGQIGGGQRAPEHGGRVASLVRPLGHQSQRLGRGRHGALGHCRQGRRPLALRHAGWRRADARAGDGEPRSLQRRGQGHGAHRRGAGRQGRRGQGPRVRPRHHRSGKESRRPEMPFVADCNNAHALGRCRGHRSRWQALNLVVGRSGVAARSPARAHRNSRHRRRPGRRSRLGRAAGGLCQAAGRRPAARHLHDRRRIGE